MRLIDADEAIERFTQIRPVNPKKSDYTYGIEVGLALAKVAIRDQKTIEPQRKNGRWINIRHDNIGECDQCGITGRAWMNFCFDCGADMRAERRTDGRPDKQTGNNQSD